MECTWRFRQPEEPCLPLPERPRILSSGTDPADPQGTHPTGVPPSPCLNAMRQRSGRKQTPTTRTHPAYPGDPRGNPCPRRFHPKLPRQPQATDRSMPSADGVRAGRVATVPKYPLFGSPTRHFQASAATQSGSPNRTVKRLGQPDDVPLPYGGYPTGTLGGVLLLTPSPTPSS